jgi:hypothetical protein
MAVHGLIVLVCAGAVLAADPPPATAPVAGENVDNVLATTLAVQTALQQGKEHLLHGEYRAAVNALEAQLAYINGNAAYLRLLQDAYRGYIKELRLAKQDDEAQRYLRRLRILDGGALLDSGLSGGTRAPAAPGKSVANAASRPALVARGKIDDKAESRSLDDPFDPGNARRESKADARALLAQAEQQFADGRYREARLLYEQAVTADRALRGVCGERWGYCKLFYVAQQLKQSRLGNQSCQELEDEVRNALALVPRLEKAQDFGRSLLTEIHRRQQGDATADQAAAGAAVAVRHLPRTPEGYFVAETANFRIFHTQTEKFAQQVAQVAERTRSDMQQKWFSGSGEAWSPRCDLYLYATAKEYERASGVSNSPGHSYIRKENGRVVVRRIELHCEEPNLLSAVLPHETTHVVLADHFGEQLAPPWADEGMAVLAEPRSQVERHLKNLPRCQRDGRLFPLSELLQLEKYPRDPTAIKAFYAQSVSLVEFLSNEAGPQEFTFFLYDGMRYGYEKALQRHYGYKSLADLERRWSQQALRDGATPAGVAQRSP